MSTFTTVMLLGWAVLIASWFPKKWFIKDDQTRRLVNICLAAIAFGIFVATGFAEFILKPGGL
jgi:hypothetical protein